MADDPAQWRAPLAPGRHHGRVTPVSPGVSRSHVAAEDLHRHVVRAQRTTLEGEGLQAGAGRWSGVAEGLVAKACHGVVPLVGLAGCRMMNEVRQGTRRRAERRPGPILDSSLWCRRSRAPRYEGQE